MIVCLALFILRKGKRMYKEQRNYENVQKMMFQEIGNYGVAQIEPTHFESAEIGRASCRERV